MSEQLSAQQAVLAAHHAYMEAWNEAIRAGDSGEQAAAYLSKELHSWFANTDMEAPSTGDYADYAESIRQAVGYLKPDARWSSDHISINLRSETEAVLACRTLLERRGKVDPMLCLSVWRKEADGQWRLYRIYEEVGLPGTPDDSEVRAAHGRQFATWLEALQTGDGTPCGAFIGDDLQWLYTGGGDARPEEHRGGVHYTEGLREAAQRVKGIGWREHMLVTAMRSPTEGMVLVHGAAVTKSGEHSVFDFEIWRKIAGAWRIIRLYQES